MKNQIDLEILETEQDAHPGLIPIEKAKKFILAGNCTFTIKSLKTGQRFTYKFSIPDTKESKEKRNFFFVSVLTGSSNLTDFTYAGTFTEQTGFRHGTKSRISESAPSLQALIYSLTFIISGTPHPNIEIWHEGTCARCGRKLTDPDSIASGFGPFCISFS